MKPLREAMEEYLALRRSLGFKLHDTARGLRAFAAFLEQKAAPYITTALAVEWAMQPVHQQPSEWARRLGFVRVFARHWRASDPRTEIPPAGLLPRAVKTGGNRRSWASSGQTQIAAELSRLIRGLHVPPERRSQATLPANAPGLLQPFRAGRQR